MVRWIAGINPESFVVIEAGVQRPIEPVKRCRVSNFELRITRCYLLAPAPVILGMTLAAANRPVVDFNDEVIGAKAGVREEEETDKEGPPAASMLVHLDNIAMHKRAPVQQAIADIRMEMKHLFRSYLKARGFKEFEPPSLLAQHLKVAAMFSEAFLAQSPQFYKQFEIAGGRKRVFSIAPVFRAENSNTPRHMTEFTGLDLEMEIRHDYSEVLYLLEGVLLYIFRQVHRIFKDEIELVRSLYPSSEILLPEPGQKVRLTFTQAQQLLREEGPAEFRHVRDDEDMTTPQEKALGALVRQKFNTDFYVVDKFPETARPFYAKLDDTTAAGSAKGAVKVTNAFDMFLQGQEILSGGQRINHPDELEARIRAKGIDPASPGIDGYVQVFRQVGVPPHGGGGIGLDRIVAWYLGLPSVHLAAYYPRTPRRLLP
ncbi:hypothetical protein QC763_406640 [Podospora pseudopauciseta]|uniref:aspartate--tRNA ligase n=1 Tax=Podospora pseudopauciseta TaxID=2093780 RepID=A0ABR0HE30_9PEZI|nr:hypothetical protein QC763_406640 [Podospora pseudopauciseta]